MSRCGGAVEGDVVAAEDDAAGGRQFEPGDHAERRRLAAARRPEHDEELAVGDGEVRIADCDELAEGLVQILDADLSHRAQSTKWLTMTNIAVPNRMVAKDQP